MPSQLGCMNDFMNVFGAASVLPACDKIDIETHTHIEFIGRTFVAVCEFSWPATNSM